MLSQWNRDCAIMLHGSAHAGTTDFNFPNALVTHRCAIVAAIGVRERDCTVVNPDVNDVVSTVLADAGYRIHRVGSVLDATAYTVRNVIAGQVHGSFFLSLKKKRFHEQTHSGGRLVDG